MCRGRLTRTVDERGIVSTESAHAAQRHHLASHVLDARFAGSIARLGSLCLLLTLLVAFVQELQKSESHHQRSGGVGLEDRRVVREGLVKPVVTHFGYVPFRRRSCGMGSQVRCGDSSVIHQEVDIPILGGDVVDDALKVSMRGNAALDRVDVAMGLSQIVSTIVIALWTWFVLNQPTAWLLLVRARAVARVCRL